MVLLSFMKAGALHGLANVVSLPPAAAIAWRNIGMRYLASCLTEKLFSAASPSLM